MLERFPSNENLPKPEDVARAERSYSPGQVPEPVWLEHIRLNAVVTVEITPYKVKGGKIMVYMETRPDTDPFYAGLYHMPGTMCNGNDKSLEDAITRVKAKEMQDFVTSAPEPITSFYRTTPRGNEGVFMFLLKVYDGGSQRNWFDAENLPENTIPAHREMVEISLKKIKAQGSRKQTTAFE